LTAYFAAHAAEGRITVLLVDADHRLEDETLGHLRLLISVDKLNDKSLLQIVLAGRPEIDQRLAQLQLRSLQQRIAFRCRLTRWEERDIELFILQR
jgi:type II secretory pathway predicted ATPase ExeA